LWLVTLGLMLKLLPIVIYNNKKRWRFAPPFFIKQEMFNTNSQKCTDTSVNWY
jgi:hypothetical protein